jgi:ATP-dependent RNA helicase RhlE
VDELNRRQGSVIIFAKTKRKTDELAKYLKDYGFAVALIHGGRSQGQRNQAISQFKQGKHRILCATDVAARGIDIPAIEHVINYDLPMMTEDYVHRIGRTGRNGAAGEALSFVGPQDYKTWLSIARKYKIEGVSMRPPSQGDSDGKYRAGAGGGRKDKRGGPRKGGFAGRRPFRGGPRKASRSQAARG